MTSRPALLTGALALALGACGTAPLVAPDAPTTVPPTAAMPAVQPVTFEATARLTSDDVDLERRLAQYVTVPLTADLSGLSENTRAMIPLLLHAARAMDEAFWLESSGPRSEVLAAMPSESPRRYAMVNYGPWDRLDGNEPFIDGVGPKPPGANFYPHDMTTAEFEAAVAASSPARADSLRSLYTVIRRDAAGRLVPVPYHVAFAAQHRTAAMFLRQAAELAEDPGLARYLSMRADALLTDEYQASDFAWMEMRDNPIDFVVGPIENYEDALFGYRAAHEAYVLIKDQEWSRRLARFAQLLPSLQAGLPVPPAYRAEVPGTDADLNAYDAVFYAGDSNSGSKTIAINLPNDEEVQLRAGSRRLQLKNVMRAKFDAIMAPIAGLLIAPDQRSHVTFDAFFGNTMFHEVAHGLGIKNTINGSGTVREALREQYSALEEGKADVVGLYMVRSLIERGEWEADPLDHYVTFVTGIFRSIRFGAASAHGRANLVRFNFFREMGAIERRPDNTWAVNPAQMSAAVDALSARILTLQGDGSYDAVTAFVEQYGQMTPELEGDLARLATAGIPVDVVFEQGEATLGLPVPGR